MPPGPLRSPQDALPDTSVCMWACKINILNSYAHARTSENSDPNRPKIAPRQVLTPFCCRSKQLTHFHPSFSSFIYHTFKIRNRRKHVEKKRSTTVIHGVHSHWPLKSRKHFRNCRNTEGGGGGRAKRSSIRRPQHSTACCESIVKISCFSNPLKEETFAESL